MLTRFFSPKACDRRRLESQVTHCTWMSATSPEAPSSSRRRFHSQATSALAVLLWAKATQGKSSRWPSSQATTKRAGQHGRRGLRLRAVRVDVACCGPVAPRSCAARTAPTRSVRASGRRGRAASAGRGRRGRRSRLAASRTPGARPPRSSVCGGPCSRSTCPSPSCSRILASSRGSSITGAFSRRQSSSPITIAERRGRSTTLPTPKVWMSALGRSAPTRDRLVFLRAIRSRSRRSRLPGRGRRP